MSVQIIALTSSGGRELEHDSLMDHNKIGKPSCPRPRKLSQTKLRDGADDQPGSKSANKFLFIHPRRGFGDSHFCKMALAES